MNRRLASYACGCLLMSAGVHGAFSQTLFQGNTDIGMVAHPGSTVFDAAANGYTLTGSGENIWGVRDDFQFAWKKVSAVDLSLAADIAMLGSDGDPHRKAVLMVRQTLDADSAYADAAVHGNGLTSLQFRESRGAATHEIEVSDTAPRRMRIEKHGDRFYLFIGNAPGGETFAGGDTRVVLQAPFYVGIGVSAHHKEGILKVLFSNVDLRYVAGYSTIETISVASTDARVSYVGREQVTAPEYSEDGRSIVFRSGDKVQSLPVAGGVPQVAAALPARGSRTSPDGKLIAITLDDHGETVLAVVTVADGTLKMLARFGGGPESLSMHPWSPDGKRLVFVSYQAIGSSGKP